MCACVGVYTFYMLIVMQAEQSEIEGKLNQLKLEVEKAESLLSRSIFFFFFQLSYPSTIFSFFFSVKLVLNSLHFSLKEEENMVIEKASAGGKEMEHIEDMV